MRDEVDELALEQVRVLELVDHHDAEAQPRGLAYLLVVPKQIASRELEVLEIDDRLAPLRETRTRRRSARAAPGKARDRCRELFQRGLLEPLARVLVRGGACSAGSGATTGRRRAPARCPPPRSCSPRPRCSSACPLRSRPPGGGASPERAGQRVLEARAHPARGRRATRRAQRLVDAREHPAQAASTVRRKKAKALRLAAGAERLEARSNASPRSTAAPASSSSRNRGSSPTPNGYAFRRRLQKPWIVEIQAPSSSRARSWRPRSRSAARIRLRSSPAALRVYVMTRIDSTSSPRSHTARTYRSTRTDVFPVPAPAETKTFFGRLDGLDLLLVEPCQRLVDDGHERGTRQTFQRSHHAGQPSPFGSWRTSPARIRSAYSPARSRAVSTCAQKASSSR